MIVEAAGHSPWLFDSITSASDPNADHRFANAWLRNVPAEKKVQKRRIVGPEGGVSANR